MPRRADVKLSSYTERIPRVGRALKRRPRPRDAHPLLRYRCGCVVVAETESAYIIPAGRGVAMRFV